MDLRTAIIKSTSFEILSDLAKFPVTSYWEAGPAAYVRDRAMSVGLEVSVDQWGNVLVEKPGTDRMSSGIAFVAHMDHPGYEVVAQRDDQLVLKTLGGMGIAAGTEGTAILVIDAFGRRINATVTGAEKTEGELQKARELAGWLGTDTVYARLDGDHDLGRLPLPAVPDLPDCILDDDLVRMRAADDLAGCAAILTALEMVAESPFAGSVYGLFTRAEEVGLIGARLVAEDELIPKNTVIVSVETSSALPGAEIGQGVVIRTGDRTATFDYEAEVYLNTAVERIRSSDQGFKVQRQLMSAGGCEAAAFKAYGYKVTGLALPLGCWHNRGESGVELEIISTNDFLGETLLIVETSKLAGTEQFGTLEGLLDYPIKEGDRLKRDRSILNRPEI
ncbi:MAG: M28 family peptidase [SAR202 cluster bacterium]|nr:M28 family peptidase [SAR202 cluster bacterium]